MAWVPTVIIGAWVKVVLYDVVGAVVCGTGVVG